MPGETLLGGDLDEEQHGLGERLLLAGQDLGVAHRVGERQDDVGQGHAADGSLAMRWLLRWANLYDELRSYADE